MNPVREWIDTVLRIAREQAQTNQLNRKVLERLFLFGIEIGRGTRLTLEERARLARTVATAEAFMAVLETCPEKYTDCLKQITEDCISDWPKFQPGLRRMLERSTEFNLEHVDPGPAIWPGIREWFANQLESVAHHYPQYLSKSEIPDILDRLDHPLDRA
jgi:hypothetical protein